MTVNATDVEADDTAAEVAEERRLTSVPAVRDDAALIRATHDNQIAFKAGSGMWITLPEGVTQWPPQARDALSVINLDQAPVTQVLTFFKMCEDRGLNPWAEEAYLIGRKAWNKDIRDYEMRWTPQTGIDGYRHLAEDSGEYLGVVSTDWCGADGKWVDVWLSDEPPKAARVKVMRVGFPEPVSAVAMWSEYAPYEDEYAGSGQNRRKTGKKVLTKMWQQRGAGQLAKCAEALADRRAFPRQTSGLYIHEEMHRADIEAREIAREETRKARTAAFEAAKQAHPAVTQHPEPPPAPGDEPHSPPPVETPDKGDPPHATPPVEPTTPPPPADDVVDGAVVEDDPTLLGDTLGDVVADLAAQPEVTDAMLREWVMAELAFGAEAFGIDLAAFTKRYTAERSLDEFTLAELTDLRDRNRRHVVNRLRKDGKNDVADVYEANEGRTAPLVALIGTGAEEPS